MLEVVGGALALAFWAVAGFMVARQKDRGARAVPSDELDCPPGGEDVMGGSK